MISNKKIKDSIKILLSTLFFFFFFNIIISLTWFTYNELVTSKRNLFPEKVRNNFTLSDQEQKKLHHESKLIRYKYEPFLGPITAKASGEFINVGHKMGRLMKNNDNCTQNIYFFGGSTTFGWLSIDSKTIPAEFKKILEKVNKKDLCVFNFGQPWFYSKQENNYLINLIEKGLKPDMAIFLNGINERCHGHALQSNIKNEFDKLNVKHRTFVTANNLTNLISSLPIFQLVDRVKQKALIGQGINNDCSSQDNIAKLYEERLKLRNNICITNNINCYTFLQPFGLVNGNIYYTNHIDIKRMKSHYKNLKQATLTIDITDALDGKSDKINYVDGVHYSHEANKFIAETIYQKIY